MDWKKFSDPGAVMGALCLASMAFGGKQVMEVPDKLAAIERDTALIIYRVEQLEKAVERSSRPVVDVNKQEGISPWRQEKKQTAL